MAIPGTVSRRILVVDDDPLVADSIRRMLLFDGHEVEVAGSGQEALTLFEERNFELTLLDYEMPIMKGDALAAAIKALVPDHPVVMFTGFAEMVGNTGVPLKGVDFVLGKPFDLEELRRTLVRFLPPLKAG
jgi:two-component system, OmpR family, response regulator MprA